MPSLLAIDVLDATRSLQASELASLHDKLSELAAVLRLQGSLEVRCIDDAEMIAAHAKFLNDATTTDVITFDNLESTKNMSDRLSWRVERLDDDRPRMLDTTLLLCVDVARRQSKSRGLSVHTELLLYAIHGILHCLGWDDELDDEFAAMHAFEDELLQLLRVGTVFGTEPTTDQADIPRA